MQQQSPWLEGAYGWNFGEGGWNTGMDSNLLKFSFMFDRNVDGVVASLPPAVDGQAYFLTTDSRLYFAVGTTWFSSPTPKWFQFVVRSTGEVYQFDGTVATQIDSLTDIDSRLTAVEATIATLGTAAFENVEDFATQAELDVVEAQGQQYVDTLRSDLSELGGSGLVGFSSAVEYAEDSVGKAIKDSPVENALWAGFFDAWPMGYSMTVGTVERVQIPAGVTHGRAGFVAGTTVFNSGPGQMRVQRNVGDSSTANHTVCLNLSAAETAPLRGKQCTAHVYLRAGATYSGAGVTFRVQYSVEPEQPVLSSVAQYSNGYVNLDSVTFLPGSGFPASPQVLTFTIPENATQVAIAFIVPFNGTAGASDYVEFKECQLYESATYRKVRTMGRAELDAKSETRYQTSYPYGSSFGANSTQGAVNLVSSSTAVNWAMSADIRFSQRMVVAPRFQFIAPGSGTRSRMLNVGAGTFLNGIAFDISDSGVTVTNNAAATDNTRYLFQWSADCLF